MHYDQNRTSTHRKLNLSMSFVQGPGVCQPTKQNVPYFRCHLCSVENFVTIKLTYQGNPKLRVPFYEDPDSSWKVGNAQNNDAILYFDFTKTKAESTILTKFQGTNSDGLNFSLYIDILVYS